MPNKNEVLSVLKMSEVEMTSVEPVVLYQAFYALPTRLSPVMCDLRTGKGFEGLNEPERKVAERIARVVQARCPVPKIERWKSFQKPAANDETMHPQLRLSFH